MLEMSILPVFCISYRKTSQAHAHSINELIPSKLNRFRYRIHFCIPAGVTSSEFTHHVVRKIWWLKIEIFKSLEQKQTKNIV